ncbi:5-(carboxyamino)imidazole ribonucleotide mutase [Candidatus Nomurabacteria bacterium RIFCSPLOWO2_01_FULL_39_18]|uniref:N5-carboxyaminoimidazole ribonucleotide mutase n=1 Tax=Candidatus Nomurabacteria bacterium RIFCSPHIGHO2_01_FULL_40_24b TaxID=1801739 RepID=A0A1F6V6U3_9BACT|nr:MAG: 5-(carboxyamino)imidazole ribonucleotide mutase [Candidatus Nomurabacteria bacterium RIFCSPHIGHO2_01_FULL_40_24b]OGI89232.1 MAG: 5-(carboxyamino)imidazole ribonucleotide mutase [Candidatus Nomurabacteria bacterium RIFCSPLOWO2_01_FULL_39_18]
MKKTISVGIIMGSDSDLAVMAEAGTVIEEFDISYEITVASAHRSPELVHKYVTTAKERGIKVIIAGAGGAAHLAGVAASLTTLPVIGIPIKTKSLDGLDSLLSTISMPPGVPVATVGINAGKNAGLLAVQILAIGNKNLESKLIAYKEKMNIEIKIKGEKLSEIGYKKYLASPVDDLRPREK